MGQTTGPTMSTAAWMNERIVKENKQFPPAEQSPNRVCGKTQKDAFAVPAHGPGPDAQHVIDRRNQIWANSAFGRRAASSRLTSIHSTELKKDPRLADPVGYNTTEDRHAASEAWNAENAEARGRAVNAVGRTKCEEVAFSERMQGFSLARG